MSSSTPAERMAHARAVMLGNFVTEAREQFERLGVTPTEEQVQQSGARLLKAAQRDRMSRARETRWEGHAEGRRNADVDWAVRQVHRYAARLHTWDESTHIDELTRVCLMAVEDELAAPDGFSRARLIRRLDAYGNSVRRGGYERDRT